MMGNEEKINLQKYFDTFIALNNSAYRRIPSMSLCESFSRFNHVRLCATLWTVARQASLFMGFSRQEYWSGFPCSPQMSL